MKGIPISWDFQVGASPEEETGNLTWNQNGTLSSLAITDGFNSAGTQTCSNTYDVLNRLTDNNCGSSWTQAFSYDQFDNLTKTGTNGGTTWNPGYSATNNRYTLSGTSYDGSGNLLTDTFHTYIWGAFDKLFSVDSNSSCSSGECITYDGFGRVAEIGNSTAGYTEFWYTPLGKTAVMNGTTMLYSHFPTPGGSTLQTIGSTGIGYKHSDWLGSGRIVSGTIAQAVISDRAYAPYGEVYADHSTGGGTDQSTLSFTGDVSDLFSGTYLTNSAKTYDTLNRELNATEGRWISPDPSGSGWNAYAYTTNPLIETDPFGLQSAPTGNGSTCNGADDCAGSSDIISQGSSSSLVFCRFGQASDGSCNPALPAAGSGGGLPSSGGGSGSSNSNSFGSGGWSDVMFLPSSGQELLNNLKVAGHAAAYAWGRVLDYTLGPAQRLPSGGMMRPGELMMQVMPVPEMAVTETAVTETAVEVGTVTVWDFSPFARGRAIEQTLDANLVRNFPVIDRFDFASRTATSIKSIDLTAASYQNPATLASKLNGYVNLVSEFNGARWAGVNISEVTARELQLAIRPGIASAEQQAIINAAVVRAQSMGVNLIVTPVP